MVRSWRRFSSTNRAPRSSASHRHCAMLAMAPLIRACLICIFCGSDANGYTGYPTHEDEPGDAVANVILMPTVVP